MDRARRQRRRVRPPPPRTPPDDDGALLGAVPGECRKLVGAGKIPGSYETRAAAYGRPGRPSTRGPMCDQTPLLKRWSRIWLRMKWSVLLVFMTEPLRAKRFVEFRVSSALMRPARVGFFPALYIAWTNVSASAKP